MGGKSRSSQSTSNNQQTNNYVNDGQFAGASNVSIDESDHSVRIEEDYDYSQETDIEDSYNTDNSTNLEDSNNTDNSIEVDDGNIAGGNITFSDSGAISAAEKIAMTALEQATKQNDNATELSVAALNSNERTTARAFNSNEQITRHALNAAEYAIDEVSDVATDSVDRIGRTSEDVISSLTAQSAVFADNLESATNANFAANEKVLQNIGDSSSNNTSVIAELARNTALQGQDIVAKSSEKMTMYIAIAAAIGFIAFAAMSSRGK